ncbi:MAG: fibronectin type III domain-containing protein [Cruoricaptor ignavus]|nr:fibronectin type III domain-containing protein [Cruoricaptor ignavus]
MKNFYLLVWSLLCFSFGGFISAQCYSGSITTDISTVPNTCASNGEITVTLSHFEDTQIQLLKNNVLQRTIVPTANTSTFDVLQADTYSVKVVCKNDISHVYTTNDGVVVAQNYTAMSAADISISNTCNNFTQGGTITINNVTGGNAPYTYSIIKNNNPDYDDSLSAYSASATQNVTEFGTYQIRIKDACGNYYTVTRTLSPNVAPVRITFTLTKTSCDGTANYTINTGNVRNSSNNVIVNWDNYKDLGVKMVIRSGSASGNIIWDGTYKGETLNLAMPSNHKFYITTTTACGESYSYELDNTLIEVPSFGITHSNTGCPPNESLILVGDANTTWVYPVAVTITNTDNNTTITKNLSIQGNSWQETLPFANYSITYVDACGNTVTHTVDNPKNKTTPSLSVRNYLLNICTDTLPINTQTGTTQIYVHFGDTGYVANLENADLVIISGPSNVGVHGAKVGTGRWGWSNMLPGSYTIALTSCGVTTNYNLTVGDGNVLRQSLTSEGSSFCSGGGTITSTKVYNGLFNNTVQLSNTSDFSNILAENSSGTFSNLSAGTYYTRLKIINSQTSSTVSTCKDYTYYIPGSTVTITDATSGSKILYSAIACEASGSGNHTGRVYFTFSGVAPFTLRYKLKTETDWTTISGITTTTYSVSDLLVQSNYDVQLQDSCGSSDNIEVFIGTVEGYSIANVTQPCVGSSYTLEGNSYQGATYEWTNPQGAVVATTRTYTIPTYAKSYDGTYTLTVKWDNCVTRISSFSIYGELCGNPISQATISGNVYNDTNALNDNTVNGTGIGQADSTQLYISVILQSTGELVTTVKVNNDGTYTIPGLPNNTYKLVINTNPLGSTSAELPYGWISTGENIGSESGNDGLVDGILTAIIINNISITNANFGIFREFCYKPAVTEGVALPTKHGITALGRASSTSWPTARTGGHTVLEAKTKGFVINRVKKTSDIGDPREGMLVYDTENDCISLYDGTSWKCLKKPGCPD